MMPGGPNGASRQTAVPSRRVRYRTADPNNDGASRRVPDVTIFAAVVARERAGAAHGPLCRPTADLSACCTNWVCRANARLGGLPRCARYAGVPIRCTTGRPRATCVRRLGEGVTAVSDRWFVRAQPPPSNAALQAYSIAILRLEFGESLADAANLFDPSANLVHPMADAQPSHQRRHSDCTRSLS